MHNEVLDELAEYLGLTLHQMAGELGYTHQYLYRLRNGDVGLGRKPAARIAEVYAKPLKALKLNEGDLIRGYRTA